MPTNEEIARVAHEANRAYCETLGDDSQPFWEDAPQWQRDSALAGVEFHAGHPDAKPEDSHNSWLAEKKKDGWKYGDVKDPEKKEHPCFVPYEDLPVEQQKKDSLFIGVVRALLAALLVLSIPGVAFAQEAAAAPWWVPVVQAVATGLVGVLSIVLIGLATRGFKVLDQKMGWNTEGRGSAVASRLVLDAEQTLRKAIAQDFADGKITAEEARARLEELAANMAAQVAEEIGVGADVARSMVEAAVAHTGASSTLHPRLVAGKLLDTPDPQ